MRIALCIVATGKYRRFLPCLLTSAERFFCIGHDVRFLVFTNIAEFSLSPFLPLSLSLFPAPHEPWPGPTLHRYRTMLQAEKELLACDYAYYIDADSRFVRPVGEEIFGRLTATIHYGFVERPRREWTYETRLRSRAGVTQQERRLARHYYCGGFQGGRAGAYVEAMRAMDVAIADDERGGITAWWHDESHWNRYLIDHPPEIDLSHEYMCPASWRPETQRIVIVDKDNGEVRS